MTSWVLLEELLQFDWHGKRIWRRAKVDSKVAHFFVREGPDAFAEGWPPGVPYDIWERGPGTEVRWIETYAEAVGPRFFEVVLPGLSAYGPACDVRAVFWFNF